MELKQAALFAEFKESFGEHFGAGVSWNGGEELETSTAWLAQASARRLLGIRPTERFEGVDLSTGFRGWTLVVEFESQQNPFAHIGKFWPYLRGELSAAAENPLLLCHFSDWSSYPVYRDLWEWRLSPMPDDPERRVTIQGQQFDHGGEDRALRAHNIQAALQWIDALTIPTAQAGACAAGPRCAGGLPRCPGA